MNLAKQLFKKNRPEFRPFKFPDIEAGDPGDLPVFWDAYVNGCFPDLPEDLSMERFLEICEVLKDELFEVTIVEDFINGERQPVGVFFVKSIDSDNWQIEPHVTYYHNANVRVKMRAFMGYLKKTKYRKDIGSCVVRTNRESTKLANKAEKLGLLQYVGKIWGGRPGDNDYLYSVRCNRSN